jgi:hypothetical protein
MIYTTTSVEEVIAKVIRATRITDSSWYEDMKEWVPEAMRKMHTKVTLDTVSEEVTIKDHCGSLPCGILTLKAVEYNGSRLRYGSSDVDYKNSPKRFQSLNSTTSIYVTDGSRSYPDGSPYSDVHRGGNIVEYSGDYTTEYYKIQMDHIQTSFEEGTIRVHYMKMPVDEKGYPLIPDNENYKTALMWYIFSMMVMAGYKMNDVRMDYEYCEQKFERFARRAMNEIRYPSTDKMEKIHQAVTRMIFPFHFYEDFSINGEQPQSIYL